MHLARIARGNRSLALDLIWATGPGRRSQFYDQRAEKKSISEPLSWIRLVFDLFRFII